MVDVAGTLSSGQTSLIPKTIWRLTNISSTRRMRILILGQILYPFYRCSLATRLVTFSRCPIFPTRVSSALGQGHTFTMACTMGYEATGMLILTSIGLMVRISLRALRLVKRCHRGKPSRLCRAPTSILNGKPIPGWPFPLGESGDIGDPIFCFGSNSELQPGR